MQTAAATRKSHVAEILGRPAISVARFLGEHKAALPLRQQERHDEQFGGTAPSILGTGALGRAVARELLKRGRTVRLVSRSRRGSPEGCTGFAADVSNVDSGNQGLRRGRGRLSHRDSRLHQVGRALSSHSKGSPSRLQKYPRPPGQRQSVYMYGAVDGEMTEESPQKPVTRKGKLRAELARMAMEAHERGKVQVALGRAPDFTDRKPP